MNDTIYHVYSKDNKVVAHNLSEDSLEEKLLRNEISLKENEIVKLDNEKFAEASY